MIRITGAILLAAMALATVGFAAQNPGTAANQGVGNSAQQNQPLIRILVPQPGARLAQSFVAVTFELTNPAASPSPNFRLQLDGRDPVVTTTTSFTFVGLTPGRHALSIELVDANNVPVAGSRTQLSFSTAVPGVQPSAAVILHRPDPVLVRAALEAPMEPLLADNSQQLPSAAGALPLLSVIGFGVLLGGIASAMKTR